MTENVTKNCVRELRAGKLLAVEKGASEEEGGQESPYDAHPPHAGNIDEEVRGV